MSFSEFSRRLGISAQAVSKGRARGRLVRCLGLDDHGQQAIVDYDLAVEEWGQSRSRPARAMGREGIPVVDVDKLSVSHFQGFVLLTVLDADGEPDLDNLVIPMTRETARALGQRLLTMMDRDRPIC